MNKEEARLLLAAWDFFDKNSDARSWEGISREEFYELMKIISGEENLVSARDYLLAVATGEISGDLPPQELLEMAKEGRVSSEKTQKREKTISATRKWISSLKAKTADEVATKQVAAAETKALIEEEMREVSKKEIPSAPVEAASGKMAGTSGGGAGLAAAAGPAISAAVSTTAPRILEVKVPVKVEKDLQSGILRARDNIMVLPFRAAAAVAGPALAKENPELATATTLVARGFATSMGAYALEQSALASGASPNQIKKLFEVMQNLPTPLAYRLASGRSTWADLAYAAYINKSFSPSQLGAFVPSSDNSTIVLTPQSLLGGFFSQISQRVLGKATSSILKGMIGGAGKAAITAGAEAVAGAAAGGAAGAATGAAAGAATGAAVGAAGGPAAIVTAAIGAIVGYLKNKIPDIVSWLKRHAKDFGAAALALLAGGVFLGNTVLIASGAGVGALALAGGGGAAIGAGARSFMNALFWGLTVLVLPSIAAPLIIAFVTLPIMFALVFFIINSSAFLVPKQVNVSPSITLPFSLSGPLPAGVPTTWPVDGGQIVQGPNGSYTHTGAQAIDILDPVGTPIKSTTEGVAKVFDFYPYGKHVEVQSQAGGISFVVRYAHMSVVSVADGQTVSAGQTIGLVGNTGNSSDPHLHYEFKGLPMTSPLLPTSIPDGCSGTAACDTQFP